jgi:hypothetical protein
MKIAHTIANAAKSIPLLIGGIGGLIIPPAGGSMSIAKALSGGDWNAAQDAAAANYLFFAQYYNGGQFQANQGRGVKLLAAGAIIYKIIDYALDGM